MKRGQIQFTEEAIMAARRALSELPKKISYIKRDVAFLEMEEDIKMALEKGYTLEEISETLSSQGVNIPAYFLKTNLSRKKKKQSRKRSEKQGETLQVENSQDGLAPEGISEHASHMEGGE